MAKLYHFESVLNFTHGEIKIEGTLIFVLGTTADLEKREGWISTKHNRDLKEAVEAALEHVKKNEALRASADADADEIVASAHGEREAWSDLDRNSARRQNPNHSEAFLKGWGDASAMVARNNPYPEGSSDHIDYDLGYSASLRDDDHNGAE